MYSRVVSGEAGHERMSGTVVALRLVGVGTVEEKDTDTLAVPSLRSHQQRRSPRLHSHTAAVRTSAQEFLHHRNPTQRRCDP